MSETQYLIAFITVTALATYATRLIPFVFLARHQEHPLLQHLGRYLPPAVMMMLVVIFLIRSAHWSWPVLGLDALIPALLACTVHLWRRNALLTLLAGTLSYMLIQQQWL